MDTAKCAGCGICARACPVNAIKGGKRMVHVIDQATCIKCGTRREVCPAKFRPWRRCPANPLKRPRNRFL
ncbi:MAG: 4Fe-4S binding protein [Dehalococcoidales bacterium]